MTDSNLLQADARTGADEAFAEIVRRNLAAVYSAALQIEIDRPDDFWRELRARIGLEQPAAHHDL